MKKVYAFLVAVLTVISGATGCDHQEEYGVWPVDYDPNPTQDEDVEDADADISDEVEDSTIPDTAEYGVVSTNYDSEL